MTPKIKHPDQTGNVRPPRYLTTKAAAAYLDVSVRWLQTSCDIPRVNLAGPGRKRGMWRYDRSDLDQLFRNRKQLGGRLSDV